jgi:2-dehydropantoate 2-reductase
MHVAIVGAGALGRVYGVRLALEARVRVTFMTRPERASDTTPLAIERVDDRDSVLVLRNAERAAAVPPFADIVLVCVRAEQIDDALFALLKEGEAADAKGGSAGVLPAHRPPIVVLTPLLPGDYERMRAALGDRVVAAMPGVVAYVDDRGIGRYWLPRSAPTLIDERAPVLPALHELVHALGRAGMNAHLELGVHETNPATTVTFVPLTMALDVAGGVDALLDDHALVQLAIEATREGAELAAGIGKVAAWASVLVKFVGPTTLKIGVGIARHTSPEAVRYVEEHFGRKLHAQNVRMAEAIVALAEEKGTPRAALSELLARLRAPSMG